jgi:hypothetical protein
VPTWLERYMEIQPGGGLEMALDAVARTGCYSKVRTGGVTADGFPSPETLASFVRGTIVRDVPYKATAGLHHPVRNPYPLTYEPESPTGRMHGFVNLLFATAVARRDPSVTTGTLSAILDESSPAAFAIDEEGLGWKDIRLSRDDLASSRAQSLRSIGSCSFQEPVEDLRALGWWPKGNSGSEGHGPEG